MSAAAFTFMLAQFTLTFCAVLRVMSPLAARRISFSVPVPILFITTVSSVEWGNTCLEGLVRFTLGGCIPGRKMASDLSNLALLLGETNPPSESFQVSKIGRAHV